MCAEHTDFDVREFMDKNCIETYMHTLFSMKFSPLLRVKQKDYFSTLYEAFQSLNENLQFLIGRFYLSRRSYFFLETIPNITSNNMNDWRIALWACYLRQLEISDMSAIFTKCEVFKSRFFALKVHPFIEEYYHIGLQLENYFRCITDCLDSVDTIGDKIEGKCLNTDILVKIMSPCNSLYSVILSYLESKKLRNEDNTENVQFFAFYCAQKGVDLRTFA